jgi:hypothetical protein
MYCRSDSKGMESRRGNAPAVSSASIPPLAAATIRAPSVGSPWTFQASSSRRSRASLQRRPARRHSASASGSGAWRSTPALENEPSGA